LLKFYPELNQQEKEKLLKDIASIDFEEIQKLNDNLTKKNSETNIEQYSSNSEATNIEQCNPNSQETNCELIPMPALDKYKLSQEELKHYQEIGDEMIRSRKVVVCTMAGGQGSRLGHEGPKGTFVVPLKEPKSIFQIAAEHMIRVYKKYQVYLDWYIMTSEENDVVTQNYFAENQYFDYPKENIHFFKQGQLPLLDLNGKILLKSKSEIFKAANGNGGIFKALEDNAILDELKQNQVEYLVTCNVDNILIKPIDAIMFGVLKEKETEIGIKSVIKRNPTEPVGACCLKNGKPTVVEYIDLPKELAEETLEDGSLKFGEVHFGCNYLSRTLLQKIADEKLPYHAAKKKNSYIGDNGELIVSNDVNSIKYEMFVFDGFEKAESALAFRVKREEEFAPIKYKDGEDSPFTASKMYEEYWKNKVE